MATDSLYWQTGLLLNLDAAGTTIADISPTPKTGTCMADAIISTAQSKYGGGSLALDGTGDYVKYSQHADFDFGSGDFCVELFYRPTTVSGVDQQIISYGKTAKVAGTTICWGIHLGTSGKLKGYIYSTVPTAYAIEQPTATVVTGTWYHLALVREGLFLRFYVDGALVGSALAITSPGTINSTGADTRELYIGRFDDGTTATRYFNGYVDQVRITKGSARYTAAFTPPTAIWEASVAATSIAELTAPTFTLSSYMGGDVAITAPTFSLEVFSGSNVAWTAPMGALSAGAHNTRDAGEEMFDYVAPMGLLSSYAGANASLTGPSQTLAATASGSSTLAAALEAPMGTLSATATGSAMASAALSARIGSLIGYAGAVLAVEAPMGTLTSTGVTGAVGSLTATLPLFELTSTGTMQAVGRADLTAPMLYPVPVGRAYLISPMGRLTVIGTATVAVTYEAYAINLKPLERNREKLVNEVTRYTNFPFNQIVRYQNSYFGVAADGLYLLQGTTDYASPTATAIPWVFKTAMTDDKSPVKKTVLSAYFGGRLGPAATVTLYPGEDASTGYAHTTPRDADPATQRQKFGRGIKSRYYALGVSGTGVLELDTIDPEVVKLTRKL